MLATWIWKNPLSARVIARLRRLTGWKTGGDDQQRHVRSMEQEYQIFNQTAECRASRKPQWVRYLNSMLSDENVFYLRRK